MKKISLILLLWPLCFFSVSGQDPATTLLDKVKARLSMVHDYVAEGTMKTDIAFLKVPDSRITVYFKQPGKINVKKQDGISIIPKGGFGITFSTLLESGSFQAVDAGNTVSGNLKLRIIKLLPLAENSDLVLSTLYIDETKSLVMKASSTTKNAGTYEVQMVYGKYSSWALPDTMIFSFDTKEYKMPKGVTFDYDNGGKTGGKNPATNTKGKIEIVYTSYLLNKGVPDAAFTN